MGVPFLTEAVNWFMNEDTNKTNQAMQDSANQTNINLANESNRISQLEAEKNRQFQAKQSASAYQTAVKDMKKAGLNPALAYSQGGAQAMSGSTASTSTPTVSASRNVASHIDTDALTAGFSTAQQAKMNELNYAQSVLLNEAARKTQETIQASNLASARQSNVMAEKLSQDKTNSIADLALRTGDQKLKREALDQSLKNQKADARLTDLKAHTVSAQLGGIQAQSNWEKEQADYKTKHSNIIVPLSVGTDMTGRVMDGISSALNVWNLFKPRPSSTSERIDPRSGEIIHTKKYYKGR